MLSYYYTGTTHKKSYKHVYVKTVICVSVFKPEIKIQRKMFVY